MRTWKLVSLMLLGTLLGGCLHPLTASRVPAAGTTARVGTTLQGWIAPEGGRRPQAVSVADDIAPGATVSLIDTVSQNTVASTITTPDGAFVLRFGAAFKPDPARSYYLEAVKGVRGGNLDYNQAGAEAVRLRNLLFFRNGWVSLTNAAPGDINIGIGTTALSAMLGLKVLAGEPVDASTLIGCLDVTLPGPSQGYTQGPGNPFSQAQYEAVFNQVTGALAYDQDPIRYISYNPLTDSYLKVGTVFTLTGLSTTTGAINDPVTLIGSNFDGSTYANNHVQFNGVAAVVTRVYDGGTKLDVTVPVGATSGPVSLEIGGTVVAGDRFTVRSADGHNSLDPQGRLLVVNSPFDTLCRVTADGTVTTIADAGTTASLSAPRALTLDSASGKLYVACYGSGKIVRFDYDPTTGTVAAPTDWAVVAHPAGLALDSAGNLYVASLDEGVVTAFDSSGATLGTHAGFDHPVGLGFDYQGYLFVAEQGNANKVTRLNPADDSRLTWAYVSTPWGLAVDSGGNVFVASNTGNAVFKVDPTRTPSTYAAVPNPTGLDLDEAGALFVADGAGNRILRVATNGGLAPVAYGIANSYGYALDASNNRYVALSGGNAILKISADGLTSSPFAVGIANPYGLTFRAGYLYASHPDTGGVTRFDPDGVAASYGRGVRAGTGLDVDAGGIVWANKYFFNSIWYNYPPRGYDQDGGWHYYPGLSQIPAFGTATDALALLDTPRGIAARSGVQYLMTNDGRLVKLEATGVTNAFRFTLLDSSLSTSNGAQPRHIGFDLGGNLLATDSSAGKVYQYAADFASKTQVGSNTLPGVCAVAADPNDGTLYALTSNSYGAGTPNVYKLSGGSWVALTSGGFNQPRGLTVRPDGQIAVADWGSGWVRTVDPATGGVSEFAKPYARPSDVDSLTDGQLMVNVDSCGSTLIRIDTVGNIRELGGVGCGPELLAVDRSTDTTYSTNYWSQVFKIVGNSIARYIEGINISYGEVLTTPSGHYVATSTSLYKLGIGGAEDLAINLGFRPQAMALSPSDGKVYYAGTNNTLYRLDDESTGANSSLCALPTTPQAMDAGTSGQLEFIGTNGRLYQLNAANTAATQLTVGLQQPDF